MTVASYMFIKSRWHDFARERDKPTGVRPAEWLACRPKPLDSNATNISFIIIKIIALYPQMNIALLCIAKQQQHMISDWNEPMSCWRVAGGTPLYHQ